MKIVIITTRFFPLVTEMLFSFKITGTASSAFDRLSPPTITVFVSIIINVTSQSSSVVINSVVCCELCWMSQMRAKEVRDNGSI